MAKDTGWTFEQQLFKAADKLRKNIDASEYKYVVLGLVFLKYISDNFSEIYNKLSNHEFSEYDDPEDRDEYKARNIFFVPEEARWNRLQEQAKSPKIGVLIDKAMESIENENKQLKWVLPKVYWKENIDSTAVWWLIDLISNTDLQEQAKNHKDLFWRVYEYFLWEFANKEWKKWWEFYTPKCVVKFMVEMIEPYKGLVFDPACWSWGMFVMSEKFVQEHQGNVQDITIYWQESNQTTWKLAKMNLAIRNINSEFVKWNVEWSFLKDLHLWLKADFVLANPPFNQKDWWQELLLEDARREYWTPPVSNANFWRLQHMIHHLSPNWKAAVVLWNWSLVSDDQSGEIRSKMIEDDLVECVVLLPNDIFYNTDIPACVRFINRNKTTNKNKILCIDLRKEYKRLDRKHVIITDEQIKKAVNIFKSYKEGKDYKDIEWYCKSVDIETIRYHQYFISPWRFVWVCDDNDYWNIESKLNNIIDWIKTYPEDKLLDKKIWNVMNDYGKILFEKYFLSFNWNLKDSEIWKIPEDWKIMSVWELVEESSIKNKENIDAMVYSVTKNHLFVASEEYFNKQVFSNDLKWYKIIKKNEFWYNPARINIGSIWFFNLDEIWLVSPAYTVFKVKSWISPYFVRYLLNSFKIFEQIKNYCVWTVRQVFRFRDFQYIKFAMPPKNLIDKFEEEYKLMLSIKENGEKKILSDFVNNIEKSK